MIENYIKEFAVPFLQTKIIDWDDKKQKLIQIYNNINQKMVLGDQITDYNVTDNYHYQIECLLMDDLIEAKKHRWDLCKNQDFIYLFNGTFWANIDKETFQKFLGEAAEKMGVSKFSARFFQFREQLFKQFLATAYLPTPEPVDNSVLINLQNGTFEISPKGTQLRPFNSNDFITYQLPFEYNPQATAPIFEKYLNTVLPEKEKQQILAEYLGFVFIKHGSKALKEEKALILYGTGANGKSVFFDKQSQFIVSKASTSDILVKVFSNSLLTKSLTFFKWYSAYFSPVKSKINSLKLSFLQQG
jgi:hypothetical protein